MEIFTNLVYTNSMEYTSRDRRAWIKRYRETGNISQVCKEFGISRPTFYKWLDRSNPDKPSKPLRSQSRRPKSTPRLTKWGQRELRILADVDYESHGRLSTVNLSEKLQCRGVRLSWSTVARMMGKIGKRCPVCEEKDRVHNDPLHRFHRDQIASNMRRALLLHAMKTPAGDGVYIGTPRRRIQCQAETKSGYRRQCKNLAVNGGAFCQYHSSKLPAVVGLWRN